MEIFGKNKPLAQHSVVMALTQTSQAPLHTHQSSAIPAVLTILLFHSFILMLKLHKLCTAPFFVGLQNPIALPALLDQFFISQS